MGKTKAKWITSEAATEDQALVSDGSSGTLWKTLYAIAEEVDSFPAPSSGKLIWHTGDETLYIYVSVASAWVDISNSGGQLSGFLDWKVKNAAYTAINKDRILADTSGGAFPITLPLSPSLGDEVIIRDATGDWNTNNVTLDRNGSNIMGLAEDMTLSVAYSEVHCVYYDATNGWRVA